ncbi:MAG: hypothetical protein LBB72_08645 [Spirochaetaceae bacterium]|nr:hypothetical protein [Spirochaetaceae bacterium]
MDETPGNYWEMVIGRSFRVMRGYLRLKSGNLLGFKPRPRTISSPSSGDFS